jgi:S1-C subfamily serine protease
VIARRDLDAALADFGTLTRSLRGSFLPNGARLEQVARGSVFAKAGLRAGDVVTAVDGRPVRSIDDAAELYVRASTTRATNVQILRAGKPITLKVQIR